MLRIKKILKPHLPKNKRKASCLLPLLVSSTFMTSAYGMDGEEKKDLFPDWPSLFSTPRHGTLLGPHILGFLDERSLGRSAQVSLTWNANVRKTYDAKHALRCKGKEPLFAAILEAVEAEPDEVTRAWHTLNALMELDAFQGQASSSVKQKLMKIKRLLLQPEALILQKAKDRFLYCAKPDKEHPALASLVKVIKDLEDLRQDPQFKSLKPENAKVFFSLKSHYQKYLENLLDPASDRVPLLQPKVILSGEGLMDLKPEGPHGICSYRISQEMALSLLSKDCYGLFLKSNTSGSHAVKRQGQVHFKGNTTTTGLPAGMESAAYWFANTLFGQGVAPTALVTLNEVGISTPAQGTQAKSDYALAQATGLTADFFTEHPHHQGAFTEQPSDHVLQASLHTEGLSLEDFMRGVEARQYDYNDLDLSSFSELIFISLLTNPSDGTPGNFMVRIDQGLPYSIVGIDNDMAFGPAVIATKMGRDKSKKDIFKPSLEVKNVLYCLPLMNHPLSPETRDKILSTSPELFLLRWLERLKAQQFLYDTLKENGYAKENRPVPYLKGYSLRLLGQSPSTHSLNTIKRGELALFCESDRLYCKLFDKERVEILRKYRLQLMGESPTADSLNSIKKGDLALFCEKGKLYCKLFDKERVEIVRSAEDGDQGFNPQIFDRVIDNVRNNKSVAENNTTKILEFTSLYGYTFQEYVDQGYSAEGFDRIIKTLENNKNITEKDCLNLVNFGILRDYTDCENNVYINALHLPLQFPGGVVTALLKDFTKLQAKIKSRPAITHNQLFSFFQPLAHRFYNALKGQYPTPLSAYRYIHNSHHEQIYLEDILAPQADEVLASGKTIGQALREVSALDQTPKQSLDESAQEIWKGLDLNAQQRVTPFLELAATTFSPCFQDRITFHQSWLQNSLLFRTLEEGVSDNALSFLIHHLKLNISVRDSKTQQNAFHYALRQKYPQDILQLLLHSLTPEDQIRILNGVDHQGLTPLDHAMEQDEGNSFLALQAIGATDCGPSIALKFYKRKVRNTPILHAAFTKLMTLNPEIEWLVSLEELLPSLVSRKETKDGPLTLMSSSHGERQLPGDIKNQIINEKGEFIQISNTGNHPVAYAQKKGPLKTHGLYFKFYPALPGLEEATGCLTRQLLGFGAPYTDLVKLGEGKEAVPCLVSQEIPGDTLLKVLKTNPQLLSDLDDEDLSGMLIAAMLINPEDGKPDNYIVTLHPTKPGKHRIIGVDNDQAFVPAIVKEKPDKEFWTGKPIPVAQVKTILYCLEQMKKPLHPTIRTIIINTHPDVCLEKWLKRLERVNNQHCGLFTGPEQNDFFEKHKSFIGVPFQNGAIKGIYEKFVLLRDLVTEKPTITHIELLSKLEPRLAKRYQTILLKGLTVEARFREVDRPFYEIKADSQKGESYTTVTQSGNILQSMGIPLKEDVFKSIRLGQEYCPKKALEELKAIRKEKNKATIESLAARVGDVNFLKTLTLEEGRVLFLKVLKKQQKTLSPQEQTAIVDCLSKQKSIRELPLPNFSAMDDRLFQSIPFEHLIKVDLRKCMQITYRSLEHLSKTALALEELNLSSITTLKEIGDIGAGLLTPGPLIFNTLDRLNLSDCIHLSTILIQAPKLHYLNVTNCSRLTDLTLDGVIEQSPDLEKLVFEGCPGIGEKELREQLIWYTKAHEKNKGIIEEILRRKNPNFNLKKHHINLENLERFEKFLKIKSSCNEIDFNDHGITLTDENIGIFNFLRFPDLTLLHLKQDHEFLVKNLPGVIKSHPKLKALNFKGVSFSDERFAIIISLLKPNEFLRELSFQAISTLGNIKEGINFSNYLSKLTFVNCPSLKSVFFNLKPLTDLTISSCPNLVQVTLTCPSLTTLGLRNNVQLPDEVVEELLRVENLLRSLPQLKSCDLKGCHKVFLPEIRTATFKFPLDHLKSESNSDSWDLSHAQKFCNKLLPAFEASEQPLTFEGDYMTEGEMRTLAAVLEVTRKTTNVQIVNSRYIHNTFLNTLGKNFKNTHYISSLFLQNCNLDSSSAKIIAQSFKENPVLTCLSVEDNMIGNEGAIALGKITSLTSLNLSHNKIKEAKEVLLPLAQNTQLQTLKFSNPYKLSKEEEDIVQQGYGFVKYGAPIVGSALGAMIGMREGVLSKILTIGGGAICGCIGGGFIGGYLTYYGIEVTSNTDDTSKKVFQAFGTLGGAFAGAFGGAVTGGFVGGYVANALGGIVGFIEGGLLGISIPYFYETENLERNIEYLIEKTAPLVGAEFNVKNSIRKKLGKYIIGHKEIEVLAKNTNLTDLNLSDTGLMDMGVTLLSQNSTLTSLNISCNNFGDVGAKALASGNFTALKTLDLRSNNIGPKGKKALNKKYPKKYPNAEIHF